MSHEFHDCEHDKNIRIYGIDWVQYFDKFHINIFHSIVYKTRDTTHIIKSRLLFDPSGNLRKDLARIIQSKWNKCSVHSVFVAFSSSCVACMNSRQSVPIASHFIQTCCRSSTRVSISRSYLPRKKKYNRNNPKCLQCQYAIPAVQR